MNARLKTNAGSWVGLVLLLLVSACTPPAVECDLHEVASVPLEVHNRLLIVHAGIHGHWVRLVVDTGAERTTISKEAADRLGLNRDENTITRSTGLGGTVSEHDAIIAGLVLGGWRFPVQRVSVGHFRFGPGLDADGLLGADILLAYDLDIDVPRKTLTLYRRRVCPDARPPWTGGAQRVAGVRAVRDRLLVPLVLDGVEGLGILDTGAQATAIGPRMAQRLGLNEQTMFGDRIVEHHGAGPGSQQARLHRFTLLRIGPAAAANPLLSVLPVEIGPGDALVGEDFINGRRIWMSFGTREVFIGSHEPDVPSP